MANFVKSAESIITQHLEISKDRVKIVQIRNVHYINFGGKSKMFYKVTFPAVVFVSAKTPAEAKKLGADKAGWDYFTTYSPDDCLKIETTVAVEHCRKCGAIIPAKQGLCFSCVK